jgi:hypothetical protein
MQADRKYDFAHPPREALIKSFDRLRTNGKWLIPFVVSLSNHERNQFIQRFPSKIIAWLLLAGILDLY